MVDFALVPECTVLLNVDLKNCFVAAAKDDLATLERINQLILRRLSHPLALRLLAIVMGDPEER